MVKAAYLCKGGNRVRLPPPLGPATTLLEGRRDDSLERSVLYSVGDVGSSLAVTVFQRISLEHYHTLY